MRVRLTDEMIRANSGEDLWDYMFESVPLPKKLEAQMVADETWRTEGIEWVEQFIHDDEEYDIYEGDDKYVFTSKCRVFNIKSKKRIRIMMYVKSLRVNFSGGTHNVPKMIKQRWGIDNISYDTLCDEAKEMVSIVDMSSRPNKKKK